MSHHVDHSSSLQLLEDALAAGHLDLVAELLTEHGFRWIADSSTRFVAGHALCSVLASLGFNVVEPCAGVDSETWWRPEMCSWLARLSIALDKPATVRVCATFLCEQPYPTRVHWVEGRYLSILAHTGKHERDEAAFRAELDRCTDLVSDVSAARLRSIYALFGLASCSAGHFALAARYAELANTNYIGQQVVPLPSAFDVWYAICRRTDVSLDRAEMWARTALEAAKLSGSDLRVRIETLALAETLIDRGRPDAATDVLEHGAIGRAQHVLRGHLAMVSALQSYDRWDEAAEILEKLNERYESAHLLVQLSVERIRQGDDAAAEAYLERALSLQPTVVNASFAALVYWLIGKRFKALELMADLAASSLGQREEVLVHLIAWLVDARDAAFERTRLAGIVRLVSSDHQALARQVSHLFSLREQRKPA